MPAIWQQQRNKECLIQWRAIIQVKTDYITSRFQQTTVLNNEMKSHDMELVLLILQTVATSITLSTTSFRRTTMNGTTTCGLVKPDLVLNLTTMSEEQLSPSPSSCSPPAASRCAFSCTQMTGCTSYNYKANVNQCEIYFNRTMPCAPVKACFHLEVSMPYEIWYILILNFYLAVFNFPLSQKFRIQVSKLAAWKDFLCIYTVWPFFSFAEP